MDPKVEEVFKLSGIPTHTFVEPDEYERLKVDIRTPGRGVVIEGPSGIGKTTAVHQVISDIGLDEEALVLSARDRSEVEYIESIPDIENHGLVVIDDFHRLEEDTQRYLANHLKILADEERGNSKLVLVGINEAGQKLVNFGHDLGTRISIIKFEANSDHKIGRLIKKKENVL
jgi:replication-associated recombination protein RarA